MSATDPVRLQVIIHLLQQTTVSFEATQLWPPPHDERAGSCSDLPSLAEEVTRRLRSDGYIGYSSRKDTITVIPLAAVKRIDFSIVT